MEFDLNRVWVEIGKRRWLKKIFLSKIPRTGRVYVEKAFSVDVDLRDVRGPSFYLMYDGPKAFENYESQERRAILKYLPQDGVFLDIGANIGLFSLFIKRALPKTKVFAFEPHPVLFQCLENSRRWNSFSSFQVFQQGLGKEEGVFQLYLDESDSGGHSFISETLYNNKNSTQAVSVAVNTIDRFAKKQNLEKVDFLKIDVQGLEHQVLEGAQATLQKNLPSILVECDNMNLKTSPTYIKSLFSNDNLNSYRWSVPGLKEEFSKIDQMEKFAALELERGCLQTNYLLVSKTVATHIRCCSETLHADVSKPR